MTFKGVQLTSFRRRGKSQHTSKTCVHLTGDRDWNWLQQDKTVIGSHFQRRWDDWKREGNGGGRKLEVYLTLYSLKYLGLPCSAACGVQANGMRSIVHSRGAHVSVTCTVKTLQKISS